MHPRATARTPKAASPRPGRVDMPTHTTRSRRICLVNPLDRDAQPRRLLVQIPSELPMRPLADLLVRHPAQLHAGLDVAHIPHRDAAPPLRLAEIDHLPRR